MVGVKIHATNVPLQSDLELHFANDGYVGLSRLPNNQVNICALFRDADRLRKTGTDSFSSVFSTKMAPTLASRLGNVSYSHDSFCAVSGISLRRECTTKISECRIGDSICMIPPLTGNGMSIALETAALSQRSVPPLPSQRRPERLGARGISSEPLRRIRLSRSRRSRSRLVLGPAGIVSHERGASGAVRDLQRSVPRARAAAGVARQDFSARRGAARAAADRARPRHRANREAA